MNRAADQVQVTCPRAVLICITGLSCTGKTTLALAISERFQIPLFTKDRFKEMMFDAACPDGDYEQSITRELSQLFGRMSLGCLEIAIEECARSTTNAVFEANLDSRLFSPRLTQIRERHPIHFVQVHLRCQGNVLLERFIQREENDRHPGHGGLRHLDAVRPVLLWGSDEPLAINATDDLIEIDTTDTDAVDYAPLFSLIAERFALMKVWS